MQKWLITSVLIPTALLSLRANAAFDDIKFYPQKIWDFEITSRYLSTTSNFSSAGGSYVSLPSGWSYTLEDFNFAIRTTVPGSNWAIWGDTQMSAAQSKTSMQTLSASGLTHGRIGTDFILYQDAFSIIPELSLLYPITTNSFSNYSTPALSDGVMTISGKLYLQFNFSNLWVEGFSGYVYRDQGRAALIPYGVVAEFRFNSWAIGGNVQGFSSASNDTNSTNPAIQNLWITSVNAGSDLFDAINPQLLETNAWVRFNLGKSFAIFGGGGATLNGANMSNYWNAQAGIEYRMGASEPRRSRPRSDVERFNEETSDGVDQSLFKNNTPAVPAQKPRVNKNTSPKNLQKELDNTEMQIDMKSYNRNHQPNPSEQEPNPVDNP